MTNPNPTHHSEIWAVLSVEESDHMVWVQLVRAFTGSGAEAEANTMCQELNDREGRERQRWLELYKQTTGMTYGSGGERPPGSVEEFKRLLKEESLPDFLPHPDYRVDHAPLFHKVVPNERMLECARSLAKDWVHQNLEITEIYLVQQTDNTLVMISIQKSVPRDPVHTQKPFFFSPTDDIPFRVGVIQIHPEDWAAGDRSLWPASFDPSTHDLVRVYPDN